MRTAPAPIMMAHAGPDEPTVPSSNMSFIQLTKNYWREYAQQRFSPSAGVLYFFLVEECNKKHWQNPFEQSDKSTALFLGGSLNTWKRAKEELAQRGLIAYQAGGNGAADSCVYSLYLGGDAAPSVPFKVSKNDTLNPKKVSGKVSNSDTLPATSITNKVSGKVSEFDTLNPKKVSGKVSNSDTTIRNKTKTSSVVEDEDEKRVQLGGEKMSWLAGSKKNAGAPASHTGGGAAADPYQKVAFDVTPYSTFEGMQKVAQSLGYGDAYVQHYINLIRVKYSDELREARDWKKCAISFLNNDARSKAGYVKQDLRRGPVAPGKAGGAERQLNAIEEARLLDRQRRGHE